ncbi:hypothetical protein SAMN02745121_05044 [Nannocystis exedens]|uniref:Uncharacterized protein n=1 Tax=Nannocystis exedens TaxID=54 RepID=A0A1I2CBS2_9BACT|nr:hypothetical protein [Nannocystis exedens]PCC68390.1 hypothetical protein NAEX_01400 [Nannocystis exedens]SFE65789.1 hypothetical protein SAMN02745121_05044 [Nannocystis exedens]
MLVRTVLTLLIFTTSTVAAAREPAPGYSGGLAPGLLAARAAQSPGTGEPVVTEPTTPSSVSPPSATPPPQSIRPPRMQASEWDRERRKLQAQTAVSWVLTGIGVAGTAVPLVLLRRCDEADRTRTMDCSQERRTAAIAAPIFGALTLASIIPAIIYSTRLARHNRYSGMARFNVTPGGVQIRF